MDVIRHKIWSDLWHNKGRTLQVVLIIAMGAFAVGMILGSSDLIRTGLTSVWRASSPAMIYLEVDPPVDDETIQSLRSLRGIEDVEGYLRANIEWRLKPEDPWQPAVLEVENLTLAQPEVKAVEMWALNNAILRLAGRPESNEDEGAILFGVPLPTKLYGPQMRLGRWLRPEDTYTVILNQDLAGDAGVKVGDWITLKQNLYGESNWQVVGLLFDPGVPNAAYMSRETLLREMHSVGKASTVWIQTVRTDPAGEAEAAAKLRRLYEQQKLEVSPASIFGNETASEIVAQIKNNFGIIITLLAAVAVVMGVVGAIGLSGALSLSVLERRREIGVMRAIGASSLRIATLFIGEGLTLGLLSWLIALPLSLPAGYGMSKALGVAIQGEIVFYFTPTGAIYWLVMITILSIAASWLPARTATQVSVRESLAYQ